MLKNEMLLHQAYIPKTVFEESTTFVVQISNIYKIFECIIPSKLSWILKIFPKSSKENLRISLATFDESNENNIEKVYLHDLCLKSKGQC